MDHPIAIRLILHWEGSSLLHDAVVRSELAQADYVIVKVDASTPDQLRRINRPISGVTLAKQWLGLQEFRHGYPGKLAIQTMLLRSWTKSVPCCPTKSN